jgi:hypothetical protein
MVAPIKFKTIFLMAFKGSGGKFLKLDFEIKLARSFSDSMFHLLIKVPTAV